MPPDVPEEVLFELGRVVACGAWLENWLAVLAAALEGDGSELPIHSSASGRIVRRGR